MDGVSWWIYSVVNLYTVILTYSLKIHNWIASGQFWKCPTLEGLMYMIPMNVKWLFHAIGNAFQCKLPMLHIMPFNRAGIPGWCKKNAMIHCWWNYKECINNMHFLCRFISSVYAFFISAELHTLPSLQPSIKPTKWPIGFKSLNCSISTKYQ